MQIKIKPSIKAILGFVLYYFQKYFFSNSSS